MECVHACALSHVQPFPTPWTAARQAALSMEFSRQEYWRGVAISYPDSGIKPTSPASPALAGRFLTTSAVQGFPGGSVLKDKHWIQLSD